MKRTLSVIPCGNKNSLRDQNKKMRRHPSHLRGKAIGLFYARLSKEKRKESDGNEYPCSSGKKKSKDLPVHEIVFSKKKLTDLQILLKEATDYKDALSERTDEHHNDHMKNSDFKKEFLRVIDGTIESKLSEYPSNKILLSDVSLDKKYKAEYEEMVLSKRYKKLLEERQRLPTYERQSEIVELIRNNQVVVITGETGCGKTTQVAQYILDYYISTGKGSTCRIVCTQPRRISAIAVAERVAQERNEICGQASVGYQIRLEKKLPRPRASILFCTAGILLKHMQDDPYLSDVSHVILDEIHERGIISDFLIALIKIVIKKRDNLKVVLMSATLNSNAFSAYYDHCPKLHIPGFTHPVETYYLEDILKFVSHKFLNKYSKNRKKFETEISHFLWKLRSEGYPKEVCDSLMNPYSEYLDKDLIFKLVSHICRNEPPGAILVFLPGIQEIKQLHTMITTSHLFPQSMYLVIALHSKMSTVQQREVFDTPPPGIRKIVISTSIAETSITINDVVYVIDSGRIKVENFDVDNNIQLLNSQWVSLANASQRKGRAGRVRPGKCYYLFTRFRESNMDIYQKPEILCARLETVILNIKILRLGKALRFLNLLMDKPDPKAIDIATTSLQQMDALDEEENLTPLGYRLAQLPIAPQLGKMILYGAWFSCLDPILSIATCLDYKDPFVLPLEHEAEAIRRKKELANGCKSDHLLYVQTVKEFENCKGYATVRKFCWDFFLSQHTLQALVNMKQQFVELLNDMHIISNKSLKNEELNMNSENTNLIRAIVCGSLYPNVAVIRKFSGKNRSNIMTTQMERAEIHPCSLNKYEYDAHYITYYRKIKSSDIFLHDTTMVDPLRLFFLSGKLNIENLKEDSRIVMSDLLKFKCEKEIGNLILKIRHKLDKCVHHLIWNATVLDWMSDSQETILLRGIVSFLSSECTSTNVEDKSDPGKPFLKSKTFYW